MSYKEDTLFFLYNARSSNVLFPMLSTHFENASATQFLRKQYIRKQNAISPDKQRKGKPLCRSEAVLHRKAISRKYRYFIDINEHKTVTTTLSVFSFISHFFWSSRLCLTKMNISLRR